MIVLGIDPGTASTGYGIIRAKNLPANRQGKKQKTENSFSCLGYGVIKTEPSFAAADRLKKIYNDLSKLIKKYRPEVLVIETLFFFRNLKTVIPVSQAGGVILLTAAKNNIPTQGFTPLQVKLAITGFGWSEKTVVQKKVKSILKLKESPKSDDAVDALAIAITYCLKSMA